MNVTLKQLHAFLAVAELGSFTGAGKRLRMAQPALSQHVRELEAELGLKLFNRTTRRVELTEGGREFQWSAAKIIEDLEMAVRNANDTAERRRGRITIAAAPLLAAVILPRTIAEFRLCHPGIQVVLVDVGTDQIVERVRSGQADCGVGTFALAEDGLTRLTLARDSLMLFCGRDSELSRRPEIAWADLHDQSLITLTRDSGIRLLVEMGYETAQVPFKPVYEVSQITTVLALVEAGLGVAVMPTYAWAAVHPGKLIAKPLSAPTISREIMMVTASERTASPATATFGGFLRKHTQRMVPQQVADA
ncbi:MAG TPA: LysR family transcriptional regulator [Stellaceae bacterium]|nr:LysR family transcriptional regulator [Stellaceae bacterium]